MRNELPIDVKNRKVKENVIYKNPWKTLRKPFRSYSMPLSIFTISAQKMKFSIKDFFSKCGRIWWHLLKKSLMENFFFCAVNASELYSESCHTSKLDTADYFRKKLHLWYLTRSSLRLCLVSATFWSNHALINYSNNNFVQQ